MVSILQTKELKFQGECHFLKVILLLDFRKAGLKKKIGRSHIYSNCWVLGYATSTLNSDATLRRHNQ